ncbi:MAG TPA: YrbL family protein [Pseudoxanthomonas sp.]
MVTHNRTDNPDWQGLEIISRGANRLCARDVATPRYCLKFELPAAERTKVGTRQAFRRWLARHFAFLGENHTELRAYRKLRERLGDRTEGALAACHELVATRWGPALRCDCVLQENGNPARSLYHHLFEDRRYPAAALCGAVDRFEGWLLRHDVPLFDLNAGNFVVVARDGALELVCIDTKSVLSGKEILPFSRWSRRLMHRKVARRCQRLRQRIIHALSRGAELAGQASPH